MRKLKTKDVFTAGRMIKKMGIKEELKIALTNERTSRENVGFEVMNEIFEKAVEQESEQLIYEFLAGPFECDPKDVEDMELLQMVEGLKYCGDVEAWKVFFKGVSATLE